MGSMHRCPHCLQDFLLRTDPCPGCVDLATQRSRAKKAKERRAAYDPVGQVEEWEFWDLLRWYCECPCCGKPWATAGIVARDHIVPVSRGGPNEAKNLQPLCQSCNLWKSDHIIYFDRHFPGRCAPLPEHLLAYLPAIQADPSVQLPLIAPGTVDATLRYPQATPRQLEAITLVLSGKLPDCEGQISVDEVDLLLDL
ncbi:glr3256 [Gloeobacter violaceus PCC 7421]|uniref:Glr3256 protein n=2 Tax=Gloeobacter violaceus TaxID=33072 RepID=Q7NGB6_GLOVI|nr:glr3256 [Gloeobacter violaceus PCC 7421]